MDLESAPCEGYSQGTTVASLAVVNAGSEGRYYVLSYKLAQSIVGEVLNESPNRSLGNLSPAVICQDLRILDALIGWESLRLKGGNALEDLLIGKKVLHVAHSSNPPARRGST